MGLGRRQVVIAALTVSLGALGLSTAHAGAAHHAPSAARPSASPRVAGQVVAFRGKDNLVYANHAGSTAFHKLGGPIVSAPAVAYAKGRYFFAADVAHHGLEIRTQTTGWAPLIKGGFACKQPDLGSNGTKLVVDCLHAHRVFTGEVGAPHHGLPKLAKLTKQPGSASIGAAIALDGKHQLFEVIGPVYEDDEQHWNSYEGFGQTGDGDDFFRCVGKPYETSEPRHGGNWVGCIVRHGSSDRLSIVTNEPNGGACFAATPSGAAEIGRIGIAATAAGSASVVYLTSHHDIVEATVTSDDMDDCSTPTTATVIATHATSGPALTAGATGYR